MRVSPNGGAAEVIASVDPGMLAGQPQMLPGGRAVLFSVKSIAGSWDAGQVLCKRSAATVR